ncbi:MAG: hypothetical protein LH702_08120 [Phormidesmis sp. CAN_BIN44]|nr:hypothetical protein [Phormidesmis sp. CAN_BIN44]
MILTHRLLSWIMGSGQPTTPFDWKGVEVVVLTATRRATIAALSLNRSMMLAIRAEEEFFDRHPPP